MRSLLITVMVVLTLASVSHADTNAVEGQFRPDPPLLTTDGVAIVKSPIIMKGIFGSRKPGDRQSLCSLSSTDNAVMASLRWLQQTQKEDGSWEDARLPPATATALGLLAFLGHGETPSSQHFGGTLKKGEDFLLGTQGEDGRFASVGSNAVWHAMATWACCETYAMTKDERFKAAAENATRVVLSAQSESGLWSGTLDERTGNPDLVTSAWMTLALQSCRYVADTDELRTAMQRAGDGFEGNLDGIQGYDETVAVLYALQLAGRGYKPSVRQLAKSLEPEAPEWDAPKAADPVQRWFLTTRAMFLHGGESWGNWNRQYSPMLVKNQQVDNDPDGKPVGYWDSPGFAGAGGRVYATTLCLMMLQVYYAYQPMFRQLDAEPPEDDEDIVIDIR